MAWKVVILALLSRAVPSSSEPQAVTHQSVSGTLDFGFVPAAVYDTLAYYEPGAIGILFHMVHTFLDVVQPNPYPRDLITKFAQDQFGAFHTEYRKPENVVLTLQVLYYEMGFLICTALGVLFVLLMPVVGLCFCMCRCCDNCGGEMHQRQRKNAECQRSFLATMLFIASLIVAAGVLCAYTANQNLTAQLKNVRKMVNSNLKDMHTFINQTPAQIDYLIGQYGTAKNKVIIDLENIGPLLGGNIHHELGKWAFPALDEALSMARAMRETKGALENMSMSLGVLRDGSSKLQASLSQLRSSIADTLNDPACGMEPVSRSCQNIRISLGQLDINADFSKLPDVSQQLSNVNSVMKTDLASIVQKGYSSFNDTPITVKEQTKNVVKVVKGLLDGVGSNITNFSKKFPVQASLANLTIFISHSHSQIEDLYPQIDRLDFFRWITCIALCCIVVLILSFNFLGLLCGICGYDKHASPTTRGCISNTGGNLLMAGVGFTFIFSWLLMGVIAASFVVGGNLEKLVCEPFGTMQLFKVVDTPYMVNSAWKNFIPGFLYQKPDINVTAESLYSNCKENQGIYSALHLDNIFNLTAYLNISLYTKDVSKIIEDVKVDLSSIILLEQEGKENLLLFTSTGISKIDYPLYLEEVNKGATLVDLMTFAEDLQAKTDLLPRGGLQNAMKRHVSSIQEIHNQQVVPIEQSMKYARARSYLTQSVRFLQETAADLPKKVSDVLSATEGAQYLITKNTTYIINQEAQKYKESIVGTFQLYINWVKSSLAFEVATCKPISNIVDTVKIVTCSFIGDSLNLFWCGLGCAVIFLIPSVILSVRLAKFYRRMDTEDVYDDMDIGNNGYQNSYVLVMFQNQKIISAIDNWN